jgi:prepilin-type N-terminal cleavage/methylation domain-containing protein
MKRAGFTMIELIFVIVILGILAAVAIPKLSATRDDAKISKGAQDVATLLADLGAHYTAHGSFATTAGDMTNVKVGVKDNSDNNCSTGCTIEYNVTNDGACIDVAITQDGNATVSDVSGNSEDTGTVCTQVQTRVADLKGKTHRFGGSSVEY